MPLAAGRFSPAYIYNIRDEAATISQKLQYRHTLLRRFIPAAPRLIATRRHARPSPIISATASRASCLPRRLLDIYDITSPLLEIFIFDISRFRAPAYQISRRWRRRHEPPARFGFHTMIFHAATPGEEADAASLMLRAANTYRYAIRHYDEMPRITRRKGELISI